jgi:hypothetical protein
LRREIRGANYSGGMLMPHSVAQQMFDDQLKGCNQKVALADLRCSVYKQDPGKRALEAFPMSIQYETDTEIL